MLNFVTFKFTSQLLDRLVILFFVTLKVKVQLLDRLVTLIFVTLQQLDRLVTLIFVTLQQLDRFALLFVTLQLLDRLVALIFVTLMVTIDVLHPIPELFSFFSLIKICGPGLCSLYIYPISIEFFIVFLDHCL